MLFSSRKAHQSYFRAISHTDISWKGIQIAAFPRANDAHGGYMPLLPLGRAGGRLILCEANVAWFPNRKNTELALGATPHSAVSDKHNIIQWPMSDGDSTSEMRSVISFRRIKPGLTPTPAKKRNFAFSRHWGLEPKLFQGNKPFGGDMVVTPLLLPTRPLYYQQEMGSFQGAF